MEARDTQTMSIVAKPPREKIGIVAGWGSFPVEVAEHLVANGHEVVVVALKGHADQRLEPLATEHAWMGVLSLGHHRSFFQRHGVQKIVLAGKIFKDKILYHGRGWIEHLPDLGCLRILGGSFITKTRDARDDTLLNALVNDYQRKNMDVLSITDVAPGLLAEEGCLTRRKPNRSQRLDIDFGWNIASRMGGLDIGQSITVKDQLVMGVEAIEGTDGLIARTGSLCPRGGFTLVKVAKPNQDMRFDVPTIGRRTVEQLARAGGAAIAIEANRTILVDREETLALANKLGIAIVSLSAPAKVSRGVESHANASDGQLSAASAMTVGNKSGHAA